MASVALADLKVHLALDPADTSEDAYLEGLIGDAEEWIEAFTVEALGDNPPRPLRRAVLLLCGHYYENREASITSAKAQTLPLGVYDLIMPYRGFSF